MNAHKSINALAGVALSAAFLGGCASQVSTDRDTTVNLAKYRTFDVQSGQVLANGVVDRRNTLVRDRVETALTRELKEKGLEPSAESPDLIATYTAGTREIVDTDMWSSAPYGWGYGAGTWEDEYTETALLIDLIDPETHKLVWRSVVEMGEGDLRSTEEVYEAVNKALERFPGA
jgi:hypothetical protein